ncbi:MAG TPA: hypothetical protein VGK29_27005 [Paludibaculum sp.]
MRFLLGALMVLTLCGPVVAQKGVGGGWAERLIVVVPLIGAGTFDDPVRPALPLEQLGSQDGVGYRYELSDDKRSAIVFLTSARVGRLRELAAKAQGLGVGLQVIEHERLGKAGTEVELKKLKKDLSLEKLAGLPPPSPPATAAKGEVESERASFASGFGGQGCFVVGGVDLCGSGVRNAGVFDRLL